MRKYLSAILMLIILCGLAVTGRAKIADRADIPGIPSIPSQDYEALSVSVIDKNPAHYTLDTRKFANIGLNEQAEFYAIYTSSNLPGKCADFRTLRVPAWAPSQYKRVFDLRGHEDIIKGMSGYGCVVLPQADRKQAAEAEQGS